MPNPRPLVELTAPHFRGAFPGQIIALYGMTGERRLMRVLFVDGSQVHCRDLVWPEKVAYHAGKLYGRLKLAVLGRL
jgi:hypothetical protein